MGGENIGPRARPRAAYRRRALLRGIALIAVALSWPVSAAAQIPYDALHTFTGDHTPSRGRSIIQASDGNFYGTSTFGGAFGWGSVFRLTPGGITILHSFTGGADGGQPGALTEASDGHLYGTTAFTIVRGAWVGGTIFKLTTGGALTVLHTFHHQERAYSRLLQASDGQLYGATAAPWNSGRGTIFRLALDGTFTTLVDSLPVVFGPIQGTDGDLYFPTGYGVYRMTLGGALTELNGVRTSKLMQASDGFFYGTTGQPGDPVGSIFRMNQTGEMTFLHHFSSGGNVTGIPSDAPLVEGIDGNLYGTTWSGGPPSDAWVVSGSGTVFRITPAGLFSIIYEFSGGADGKGPGELTRATDGSLYGMTSDAGPDHKGTVFRVAVDGTFSTVHGFRTGPEGGGVSSLVEMADGSVLGTTAAGGADGLGTIFRMARDGSVTMLHSFSGVDGQWPRGLVRASDGNFYGITSRAGRFDAGTIFRVTPAGVVTLVRAFGSAREHTGGLIGLTPAPGGHLYGVVDNTAFRMTLAGDVTTLHHFQGGPSDASQVTGPLVLAPDGNFYGTSHLGGSLGFGTLFRMTPDGRVTVLRSFFAFDGDYSRLWMNPLTLGSDGNLYGSVAAGTKGPNRSEIFRMTPAGSYSVLHWFGGRDLPRGPLVQAADGHLYGMASEDLFRVTLEGSFATLHRTNYFSNEQPVLAVMLKTSDGRLYGISLWDPPGGPTLRPDTLVRFRPASLEPPFQLTITTSGQGRVRSTSGGIDCGTAATDCTEGVAPGTSVTLAATADSGWTFVGWTGDLDCADGIVTTSTAVGCRANFFHQNASEPRYRLFWQHRTRGDLFGWNMNGTNLLSGEALQPAQVSDPNWHVAGSGDFNGDRQTDLLWLHEGTRQLVVWFMNGSTLMGSDTLYVYENRGENSGPVVALAAANWSLRAVADLYGDGGSDLIWQHDITGRIEFWRMTGVRGDRQPLSQDNPSDPAWQVRGAADFDQNGRADLLWRHANTGELLIWANFRTSIVPSVSRVSDPNWQVRAILDVDGNDRPDIVWQHAVSGLLTVWLMEGGTVLSQEPLAPDRVTDTNWEIVGHAILSRPDTISVAAPMIAAAGGAATATTTTPYALYWQRPADGGIVVWQMNGATLRAADSTGMGAAEDKDWQVAATGDLNADGHADLLWQHERTGQLVVWRMNGSTFTGATAIGDKATDPEWKVRAIGDLNRDGHPDVIWQHRREGWLAVWFMSGTAFQRAELLTPSRVTDLAWQIAGVSDFNGDGAADLVWQHEGTGRIAVWLMAGTSFQAVASLSRDLPDAGWKLGAVADIDSQGTADLIFQHTRTGALVVWTMNGLEVLAGRALTPDRVPDRTWRLVGPR